ncbi:PD-(D/E)XK nuclease family protein [Desulfovibrio sp. ZJ200]|uniref:RecB family exonuclease n=1 Tax=Desulfovibrio sp. ZJ200 TaxID=2709792 RepID=UPI0013EDDBE6|nr:PD-(D/E)XK nuclease family protein [Desulfovibrio sp. ZJ200]
MEPLLLSKSRLNTYCLCPEKYRLTYVEKIVPEKTAVPLIEGSALHHIVENCLVYGKTVPNMAEEASREYWTNIAVQETEYADEAGFRQAQEKILNEAKAFLEKIGPLNTWQMEAYFEHPLVDPLTGEMDESILLRGFADIIDQPEPELTRIIDIKTSAKSSSLEQGNRTLELTVYAYLLACEFGFQIQIPVSLLYLVRSKEPKVVWLNSLRAESDFVKLYGSIRHIATAIRQGLFWKNQGINCLWCQHQELCFGKCLAA